jgi:hypothetical protein
MLLGSFAEQGVLTQRLCIISKSHVIPLIYKRRPSNFAYAEHTVRQAAQSAPALLTLWATAIFVLPHFVK